ncbi:MAG: GNAT family N-acetyltransferase [Streptococcus sp.]|nr:GNAT family N-acetyltransferase [Streptococcus sp.]
MENTTEDMETFIQDIFAKQYSKYFPKSTSLDLEPEDIYLTRKDNQGLVGILHAQKILENIHIKALVVSERCQGKGIGSSLISELEELLKSKTVSSITLSTKSYQAKDFYLKMGYEIYATLEDVPKKGITKYHFIKRL